MANPGVLNSYDLPTGVMLDMEDVIWLISPDDVPLLGSVDGDGRSVLPTGEIFETKYDWLDEVLKTPRSNAVGSVTTTGTVLTLTAGTGINFQTGDVIYTPEGEDILVSGYGTTADTLIISRGYAGSSAAAIATNDLMIGVGAALVEGSDPPAARAHDRVDRNNYSQIFGPQAITVSGTEQAVRKYGLRSTEFDHQAANAIKEQNIAIEQAILYGNPYVGSGTAGRTMGGMKAFITTNVDGATTVLTDTTLITQLQACYDAGGKPDRIVVGSKQKRTISTTFQSSDIRITNVGMDGSNIRGYEVTEFRSDFGRVAVILDRWCAVNDAFIFERDQASVETLRPLHFEMLAKTGDALKGMVVGEKGFRFRMQTHAARFSILT